VRQQAAECVGIHAICRVNAADLPLELEQRFPKRFILESNPGFNSGLIEPEVGIDHNHPRIDIQAY